MANFIQDYNFDLFSEPLGLTPEQVSGPGATAIAMKLDTILTLLEGDAENILNSSVIYLSNMMHLLKIPAVALDTNRYAAFKSNITVHLSAILNSHRPINPRMIRITSCSRCARFGNSMNFTDVNSENICDVCIDDFYWNTDLEEYIYRDDEANPFSGSILEGLKPYNYNVLGSINFKPPF